jgi:ABC-2 type transport system ATP-binding protein
MNGESNGVREVPRTTVSGLDIDRLTVVHGTRHVLDAFTCTLEGGKVHAIVGHNGAGKTTLFDALFQFRAVEGGTMQLGSRALQRADLAYLPATLEFYPGLTGREVLRLFARGPVTSEAIRQADALDVPLNEIVDSYSYGTRRKVALIAVLSMARPVLLLDEPFEALDVVSRWVVRRLLGRVAAQGRLVLFSVHELASLDEFCDTVLLLQGGRVVRRFPEHPMSDLEAMLAREVEERVASLERPPSGR